MTLTPWQSLVLGLGLFFLGLRLVSEHFKGLTGDRAREVLARTTARMMPRVGLGLGLGALLQSATAVTFLCTSMFLAGLLPVAAATTIIIWSNVGLTLLAFVATLPLHPVVALVVGGAGIVLGTVRVWLWQTAAGILLGLGLILFGLQEMSAGAAPLKDAAWFRGIMDWASASPPLTFFVGFLAAALLQSNTGATMLIITLAGAGALNFPEAALMIYGTNLGAIPLRMLLAAGLRGDGLRLVRWEDFFCLGSGLLMMVLYYVEQAGVPLVLHGAGWLGGTEGPQISLAVVFLVSNLLPALVFTAVQPMLWPQLVKLWPARTIPGPGTPRYLVPQALEHPAAALDLLRRETARLLALTQESLREKPLDGPPVGFVELATAIEKFTLQLAACSGATAARVRELHRLRAALSGTRHLEEAARFLGARLSQVKELPEADRKAMREEAIDHLARAAAALDGDAGRRASEEERGAKPPPEILLLWEESRKHGPLVAKWKKRLEAQPEVDGNPEATALLEDARFFWWSFHRLMKLLAPQVEE